MDNNDQVQVKPTWRLAWGLFWRMFLIYLGISVVVGGIFYFTVWALIVPWITTLSGGGL